MLKIGRSTFVKVILTHAVEPCKEGVQGTSPPRLLLDGIGRAFVTSAADRIGVTCDIPTATSASVAGLHCRCRLTVWYGIEYNVPLDTV